MKRLNSLTAIAGLLLAGSLSSAKDWPQFRGPNRDDISTETGLKQDWTKDKPKLVWSYTNAGRGYSGPSIVGDKVYISGCRDDKDEMVICLNAKDGKELWATRYGDFVKLDHGGGPRGNPTIANGLVYSLSGAGDLVCMDAEKGEIKWKINFKELGGKMMSGWGNSESPLVDEGKVIVSPGGDKGTLAALDAKTGEVIWRSKDLKDSASYASVVVAEIGKVRQYITLTGTGVVGVAAKDGKMLWREEVKSFATAVIPTPVVSGEFVFDTSGYSSGCNLVKVTPGSDGTFKAEKVYSNKDMVNHHGGVIHYKDNIFGFSDNKGWTMMDMKTGNVLWADKSNKTVGKGSVTFADGRFYCLGERDGILALVEPSATAYKEVGRLEFPEKSKMERNKGMFWTHPVIANSKLYTRDLDLLYCFDISDAK